MRADLNNHEIAIIPNDFVYNNAIPARSETFQTLSPEKKKIARNDVENVA